MTGTKLLRLVPRATVGKLRPVLGELGRAALRKDRSGGRMAYVVSEDRVAHRRQISTGAYSLGAVEILAGLEPGDTIVISNLDPFRGADTVLLTD